MLRKTRMAAALAAVSIVGLLAASARATDVTYSATGSFDAGTSNATVSGASNNTIEFTGSGITVDITFNGQNTTTVASPPPVNSDLGNFSVSVTGTNGNTLDLGTGSSQGATFASTIHQTAPTSGTASYTANILGTVGLGSSGALTGFVQLAFGQMDQSIGSVTYSLANLSNSSTSGVLNPMTLVLNPGGSTGVSTDFSANITAVPEPSTMALMGLGFAGLAGLAVRRRRGR